MKTWRPTSRLRRAVTVAAVACLATTAAAALTAPPAAAATGSVTLTLSNNAVNVGTTSPDQNTATYTWAFTTAAPITAGMTQITLTVPAQSTGTGNPAGTTIPTTGASIAFYGALVGCTTTLQSSDLAPTTGLITLALSSCPGTVDLGTPAVVAISGLINPAYSVGTFKTEVVTTHDSGTDTYDDTTGVPFADNTTAVTVFVPESLTFSTSATSVFLTAIPGGDAGKATPVDLTIKTNAAGGYTLDGCVPTDINDGATPTPHTISQASAGSAVTLGPSNPGFGASASVTSGSSNVTLGDGSTSSTNAWDETTTTAYAGYTTSCNSTTDAQALIATGAAATNNDTISLTNAAAVAGIQPAGTYSGTIVYLVTPHY